MTDQIKLYLLGIYSLILLIAGWTGSTMYHAQKPIAITAHAQIALPAGSIEAARTTAPGPAPVVLAGQKAQSTFTIVTKAEKPVYGHHPPSAPTIPQFGGGYPPSKLNTPSASSVSINPAPPTGEDTPPPDCTAYISHLECPAQTITGTIAKDDDGQPDLIVHGAQSATLNVIAPVFVPANHPWAVGLTKDSVRVGGFIDRDIGPIRAGIELEQGRVAARLGWRF